MQFFDTTAPFIAIIFGAVVSSILLGLILRQFKGELSRSLKLGLLVILSIATGVTIFVSFLWLPYLAIAGVISLCCGLLALYPKAKE
jgi:hypothetical protein